MLRELWPVIRRQGFKLTESIRLDVPERFPPCQGSCRL
jgi:hypothetical protein